MESEGLGGQRGSRVVTKAPLPGQGRGYGLDGDSDHIPERKGGFRVCFGIGKTGCVFGGERLKAV